MLDREPIPTSLQFCSARELNNFIWRAIREENRHEARKIKAELDRRGVRMSNAQYGAYNGAFNKGAK